MLRLMSPLDLALTDLISAGLEIFESDWIVGSWDFREMIAFTAIGIAGGLLGGVFVKLLSLMFKLTRVSPKLNTWWGHVGRGVFVAMLIGSVAFPMPLLRNDMKQVIEYLAKVDVVDNVWVLVGLVIAKFAATLLSVAGTGTTAGIYTPVFLTGAAFGRLVGELMHLWFPTLNISPGAYAIVGAGAFASGVTRTISTAVLVVELTRQIGILLPVLVAVLVSIGVGRLITPSVYSVLIQQKDLPAMPRYRLYNSSSAVRKVAADIMTTEVPAVVATSRYADVAKVVSQHTDPTFPLIDANGLFMGAVKRRDLHRILVSRGIVCKPDHAEFVGTGTVPIAHVTFDSVHLEEAITIHKDQSNGAPAKRGRSSSIDALTAGLKSALTGANAEPNQVAEYGAEIFHQSVPFVFAGEIGSRETCVVCISSLAVDPNSLFFFSLK
jgi:CBS domain-containing protein